MDVVKTKVLLIFDIDPIEALRQAAPSAWEKEQFPF